MTERNLIIMSPSAGRSFSAKLLPVNPDVFSEEDLTGLVDMEEGHVLSATELNYYFKISPVPEDVISAALYVNGVQPAADEFHQQIMYYYIPQTGEFRAYQRDLKRPCFSDSWGYTQLHIRFELENGSFEDLYSYFLPVDNASVDMEGMANVVYNGFPELLKKNGVLNSRLRAEMSKFAQSPLDSELAMIKKIVRVYDKNFNFFMTNARFTTRATEVVDKLEKLNFATSNSLRYVVQHPEELYEVPGTNGIRVGSSVYHPRNIQMTKNIVSYDTYENRVILDFLQHISNQLEGMRKTMEELLNEQKGGFLMIFENMFSRDYIKQAVPEITDLRLMVNKLLRRYSMALKMKACVLKASPRATHVFRELPQYREIFDCIRAWYKGVYDFDQSRFLLYCIGSSRLYESFVLTEILQFMHSEGYEITAEKFEYDELDSLYQNTGFNNTFVCSGERNTITVYYQPVVYADKRCQNGINLYKKSSSKTGYYTPDYIFKIEKKSVGGVKISNVQYIICDAKFSTYETVQQCSFQNIINKYENGIEPVNNLIDKAGNCIVYGKYYKDDPIRTLYGETRIYKDKEVHSPLAAIVPISYELLKRDPKVFYSNLASLFEFKDRKGSTL